jgi:UPF0755 protein
VNFKKILVYISLIVVVAASVYGYLIYRNIFSPNTSFAEKEVFVYIPTDADYTEVLQIVTPYIKDMELFKMTAEKKSYVTNVKSGRFLFKRNMNNNDLVIALRNINNVPLNLAFNNQERLEDLAGRIGSQIESDSTSLMKSFTDETFLKEQNMTRENVLSMFIPNSYEFFWNTSADKFRERMAKEYRRFWTAERLEKAKAQNLTPVEVAALASIVHKETVKSDERPRVAGVYLNRLERGIKLEADPTVIYAVKKNANDFTIEIKRVLNKDLLTDSPYNMYKYGGLPPGPIAMPDVTALDAVLNPEKHNYIFFCASVTNFGYHEFAVTAAQHEANRQKYVAWINKRGIKR